MTLPLWQWKVLTSNRNRITSIHVIADATHDPLSEDGGGADDAAGNHGTLVARYRDLQVSFVLKKTKA